LLAGVGVEQVGTRPGKADLLLGGNVGSAAHYFHFLFASVHTAQRKPVGLGMGPDRSHLAHQAFLPIANSVYLPDLYASHSQPLGQLLNR
jgi:hypothetical protein